jgi:hypothetical protein
MEKPELRRGEADSGGVGGAVVCMDKAPRLTIAAIVPTMTTLDKYAQLKKDFLQSTLF